MFPFTQQTSRTPLITYARRVMYVHFIFLMPPCYLLTACEITPIIYIDKKTIQSQSWPHIPVFQALEYLFKCNITFYLEVFSLYKYCRIQLIHFHFYLFWATFYMIKLDIKLQIRSLEFRLTCEYVWTVKVLVMSFINNTPSERWERIDPGSAPNLSWFRPLHRPLSLSVSPADVFLLRQRCQHTGLSVAEPLSLSEACWKSLSYPDIPIGLTLTLHL